MKRSPVLPTYHETLWAAIDAVQTHIVAREIIPAGEKDTDWQMPFETGGIPYGTYKEAHFAIVSIKGKPSRKYGHVTIWRKETGTYEVNFYVL